MHLPGCTGSLCQRAEFPDHLALCRPPRPSVPGRRDVQILSACGLRFGRESKRARGGSGSGPPLRYVWLGGSLRARPDLYNVLYRLEMSVDPHDIPNSPGGADRRLARLASSQGPRQPPIGMTKLSNTGAPLSGHFPSWNPLASAEIRAELCHTSTYPPQARPRDSTRARNPP